MYCKECGKKLPDDAMFCDECGTRVEEDNMAEAYGTDSYEQASDVDETVMLQPNDYDDLNDSQSTNDYDDLNGSQNTDDYFDGTSNQADSYNSSNQTGFNNSNQTTDNDYSSYQNQGNDYGNFNDYNQGTDYNQNDYSQKNVSGNGGSGKPAKKKSKAGLITTLIILAVVVIGAIAYVGVTAMKQKIVENDYESVKRKINTENIVLSDDSKEKLNEANKNIASWNIFTLNGTERQLEELSETVDKVSEATDNLKEVQSKFDELKKEESEKGVYCNNERDKVQETLDDLKESINSNNVQATDTKKKDVESALKSFEDAIDKAYEEHQNNQSNDYSYNNYSNDSNDDTNQSTEVVKFVLADSDTVQYSENELEEFFADLDLNADETYALSIIALNEIYARHGMTFKTESLLNYFEGTDWYDNKGLSQGDISLSDVERKNAENLDSIRFEYWQMCKRTGLLETDKPSAADFSTSAYNNVMEKYSNL